MERGSLNPVLSREPPLFNAIFSHIVYRVSRHLGTVYGRDFWSFSLLEAVSFRLSVYR